MSLAHVEVAKNTKIVVERNRNKGKEYPLYRMVWRIFVFLCWEDCIAIKGEIHYNDNKIAIILIEKERCSS